MSFGETEASTALGSPVNLYLFRYGPNPLDVYGYTDAEADIDFDDGITGLLTYKAVAIDNSEITASGKLEDATLNVTAEDSIELCDIFRHYPPSSTVTLVLRQGHLDDPALQFLIAWSGRVMGFQFIGDEVEFSCQPISSSLKRPGLRRHYQYGCPHVLYGSACRADREASTVEAVVLAIDGAILQFDAAWDTDDRQPRYEGGIAAWTTNDGRVHERTILRSFITGQVVLAGPASGMEVGEVIALSLGCRHIMDDCEFLFDNILNYGGQPWIPLRSPVGLINNFY